MSAEGKAQDARRPFLPLADYGVLGDCGSAALVARDGSIDWLCWPRFDSEALFARILDRRRGGFFQVAPRGAAGAERRYVGDTHVLETRFTTPEGVLRVRDAMVAVPVEEQDGPWPEHQILRELVCERGEVEALVRCEPRFGTGSRAARCELRGRHGVVFQEGELAVVLRGELPLEAEEGAAVVGRATLRAGESCFLSLSVDTGEPATLPPLGDCARTRLAKTLAYWQRWADRCDYQGPYRAAVVRSALLLKLLTVAPSGALVAAPTTSLPEKVGGVRNWDYRYCWLRDASFALDALFELGYTEEGTAFLSWLLHTTRETAPRLHVLYDVFGSTEIRERELEHLEGWRGSRPVRLGNDACGQLQLDLYGALVDAVVQYVARGGELDRWQQRLLARLARAICRGWDQPDHGIWEVRSGKRCHTLSSAMCAVALEGLLALEADGVLALDRSPLERARESIRAAVERRGVASDGSFVSVMGGDEVDASLLLLGLYGYEPCDSERMQRTFARIRERLGCGVLLYRYRSGWDDGLPPGEGAFGLCSFWAIQLLAHAGRVEEAREAMDAMLRHANDLGLFSEQIDPDSGELLGNHPQAFTHVGVISAALAIAEAEGRRTRRRTSGGARRVGAERAAP